MHHDISWRGFLRAQDLRPRRLIGIATVGALVTLSLVAVTPRARAGRPQCFGRPATIVGTGGDNQIEGTNGRDVIVARGGFDIIDARGGRDFVCAGGTFDAVFGRGGADRVAGQGGGDVIFPGPGDDFVNGGRGADLVTYEGSSRPVRANLGRGIIVAEGRDRVRGVEGVGGGESDDRLVGTSRNEGLLGNGGDDTVIGKGGEDFLGSGAGNDSVTGGSGPDFLDLLTAHGGPGLGDDVFATSGAVVDMPAGTVVGGADVGMDTFTGIEHVSATLGDDTILGDGGSNFFVSWEGADNLQGGDGPDGHAPGPGDDMVDGGAGDDDVDYFPSDPLQIGELGPVTIDLGAGTATGLGDDDLTSIEGALATLLDDTITGSGGNNFLLLGDEGSDDISGEAGDDLLDGDIFVFGFPENLPGTDSLDGGAGTDTCLGGESTNDCESLEPPSARRATIARATLLERSAHLRMMFERAGR